MVVQHNMQALNAARVLNVTSGSQAKSTEKLASGYKINRAADDAAGLSISEKMRKQIRGLSQASTNASDGVSAVQTAEGALTEVHSMLQRMNELAVQASNGTNSETDRSSIQDEINQLTTEIDRVAESTKFNETYLLKGSNGKKTMMIDAHDAGLEGVLTQNTEKATFTMSKLGVGDSMTIGGTKYEIGAKTVAEAVSTLELDADSKGSIIIDGKSYELTSDDSSAEESKLNLDDIETRAGHGSTIQYNGKSVSVFAKDASHNPASYTDTTAAVDINNKNLVTAKQAYNMVAAELQAASTIGASKTAAGEATQVIGTDDVKFTLTKGKAEVQNDLTFNLHVGSDADMTNKIGVTINAMDSTALGIKGLNVADASGKAATYAIDAIADAVSKVSAQRSSLGAIQNRLEHTIANVDNVVENTNASESRIRDTDMAEEMVNYSKNNILQQAGQAMLAQANQSTQGVLSILG
ncbi:flagellin N-terminal helical domain-containing protein [Pseudobutyrivibrio xylanivorans]|uniref:Flagellin n=1 Tax=Pseudobutyrivibrio xylanivorans DSM 14809 TaxID=1123012 RepID=A0A1M6A6Z2_PSEXY|nr:flagellin [Pseudobutyrivibrio xylanivorans]SHI32274.1 flagellin [Pseudobutyrivibrio xylanivorans DSM 14809]